MDITRSSACKSDTSDPRLSLSGRRRSADGALCSGEKETRVFQNARNIDVTERCGRAEGRDEGGNLPCCGAAWRTKARCESKRRWCGARDLWNGRCGDGHSHPQPHQARRARHHRLKKIRGGAIDIYDNLRWQDSLTSNQFRIRRHVYRVHWIIRKSYT